MYDDDDGGLLKSFGIKYDPSDGFAAALYKRDGQYYLAFRGSEDEWADWEANGVQAAGFRTSQYEQAIRLTRRVLELTGRGLTLVGHSLGGGLASAGSGATGVRAVTFNAAGLSSAIWSWSLRVDTGALHSRRLSEWFPGRAHSAHGF